MPEPREALRLYLNVKPRVAARFGRFGLVNNCFYRNGAELILPYIVGDTVVIYRVADGRSERIFEKRYPPGTILTHELLKREADFDGDPVDLEREIFEFDATRAEPVRIARIRDMAQVLERVNATTNRTEAVYLLRFLVSRLCSFSFRAFLGAKNLQPEVRNLIQELITFLNGPLARRIPLLVRLLVRNLSGLVTKPNLIDRLWNDAIDLAEIHVPGSEIVKEIRRSTHHALGKRTLQLAEAYLRYLETGAGEDLARLGYDVLSPADERARRRPEAVALVRRMAGDLAELLGTSEITTRLKEWEAEYRESLYRTPFGASISEEAAHVLDSLRERNRWVFYHHLRILKGKAEDFQRFGADVGADFLAQVERLLSVRPDEGGCDVERTAALFQDAVERFVAEIRAAYEEPFVEALQHLVARYETGDPEETCRAVRELRLRLARELERPGFSAARLYLYRLDCLLEEMSYLALRHLATHYEEQGVDLAAALQVVHQSVQNLALDGMASRELQDLADMLVEPHRTYAEILDVLNQVQRNYHRMLQRATSPYVKMRERLGLDADELRIVVANMQRCFHDLNCMVHFADLARAYIHDQVGDRTIPIGGAAAPPAAPWDIIHLSDREEIERRLACPEGPRFRELYGAKGTGLLYIVSLHIPTRDGFILPTTIPARGLHRRERHRLETEIQAHLRRLERDIAARDGRPRRFGDPRAPLLLAVRGGGPFSMPGILTTVVFVGMNDAIAAALAEDDPWHAYDAYRRFLASFALAVWGLDLEKHNLVDAAKARYGVRYKEELPWEGMREVAERSKEVLREAGYGEELEALLAEPIRQVYRAVEAVFESWESPTAKRYRALKEMADTWHTAAVIQEMASGNHRNPYVGPEMDETQASLTGVIPRTRMTDRGVRVLTGDVKFSAAGDDLVAGVTSAESFLDIGELDQLMPMLARRLRHIVGKLRRFHGVDQEVEFTVERGVLSVLQARAAEVWLPQEVRAFKDPGPPATQGIGIRGGPFRGLVAFDEEDLRELESVAAGRPDVDGVLMVLENPTPEDIPVLLLAGGLLTAKGGSTSHAAVAINGVDKPISAVMSAAGLRVDAKEKEGVIRDENGEVRHRFTKGEVVSIHGTNGTVYLGSREVG